jgi:hypothetical protein
MIVSPTKKGNAMWQTYIQTVENTYVKQWPTFDQASGHVAAYLADKWRASRCVDWSIGEVSA